jgi:4-hydroxybenzoate polyprenyltransferase
MALMLPLAFLTYRLVYADKSKDFAFLSDACKILMILGVLSMMLA